MKFQKICIIGDGLAGLASTAIFAKKNIQVDIFSANYKKNIFDHRTTAISDSNFNYIKKALGVKNLNARCISALKPCCPFKRNVSKKIPKPKQNVVTQNKAKNKSVQYLGSGK